MTSINKFDIKHISKRTIIISLVSGLTLLSACKSNDKPDNSIAQSKTNQPEKTQKQLEKKIITKKTPASNKTNKQKVTSSQAKTSKGLKTTKNKQIANDKKNKSKKVIPNKNVTKNKIDIPVNTLTSLEQLPLTLHEGWIIKVDKLPLSNTETCFLYNDKKGMFDGYIENNLKAYLTTTTLIVTSDSNFDLTYPETGIYVEENNVIEEVNSLTISSQPNITLSEFPLKNYLNGNSSNLIIKSGFWPSWPMTETRTITFSITEINTMVATLKNCTSLLTSL